MSQTEVIKKPHLEEPEATVGTSGRLDSNEEEIDDVEDEHEEVIEEDLDDEEEEEVSPMHIPNPFLGLSPQSITNAALALAANAAQNPLKGSELDEERKHRQQLLMGGKQIETKVLFELG